MGNSQSSNGSQSDSKSDSNCTANTTVKTGDITVNTNGVQGSKNK